MLFTFQFCFLNSMFFSQIWKLLKLSTKDLTYNLFFKASSFRMLFNIYWGFPVYQKVVIISSGPCKNLRREKPSLLPWENRGLESKCKVSAKKGESLARKKHRAGTKPLTSALGCLSIVEKLSQALPSHHPENGLQRKHFYIEKDN